MKKIFTLLFVIFSSYFLMSCNSNNNVMVTFYLDQNQLGEPIVVSKGDTIEVPCVNRTGYQIDGWYISFDNGVTFNRQWYFAIDVVENDISLYAIWTVDK